jgi:hypothetical protein
LTALSWRYLISVGILPAFGQLNFVREGPEFLKGPQKREKLFPFLRLLRFAREARVLVSLNHPHIAAINGVEERALVMERRSPKTKNRTPDRSRSWLASIV